MSRKIDLTTADDDEFLRDADQVDDVLKYFGFDDIFNAQDNSVKPHNRDDDDEFPV